MLRQEGWGRCSCESEFHTFISNNSASMIWAEWAKVKGRQLTLRVKQLSGRENDYI